MERHVAALLNYIEEFVIKELEFLQMGIIELRESILRDNGVKIICK